MTSLHLGPDTTADLNLQPLVPHALTLERRSTTLLLQPEAPQSLELTATRTVLDLQPAGAAGPPGPPGIALVAATAAEPLPLLTVVYLDADGRARRASSAAPATASRACLVTAQAANPGQPVTLAGDGVDVEHDLALTDGPAYLGIDGEVTTDPRTGVVRLRVGTLTAGRLVVSFQPSIHRTS